MQWHTSGESLPCSVIETVQYSQSRAEAGQNSNMRKLCSQRRMIVESIVERVMVTVLKRAHDAVQYSTVLYIHSSPISWTHPAWLFSTNRRNIVDILGVIRLVCSHQSVLIVLHWASDGIAALVREARSPSWFLIIDYHDTRTDAATRQSTRTKLRWKLQQQRVQYPNGDCSCAIL